MFRQISLLGAGAIAALLIAAGVLLLGGSDSSSPDSAGAASPTTTPAPTEPRPTPTPKPSDPSFAPDGRTGDAAVDDVIDHLISASAAELAETYADVTLREFRLDGDTTFTAAEWSQRLASAERSLYSVTREHSDSGIMPSRDLNVVLSVTEPGEAARGWRIAVYEGRVVEMLTSRTGSDSPASYTPGVGFAYEQFLVLPPEADLPRTPASHPLTTTTGVDGVDALVALLQAHDGAALAAAATDPATFRRCRGQQPDRRDVLTRRLAEVAERAIGIHAIAALPDGHLPDGDHVIVTVLEVSPYLWSAAALYERDGAIVGLDLCEISDRPSYLYPPRAYVLPPAADVAALDTSRRSGIEPIDAFVDALTAGDLDAMLGLVSYEQVGCIVEPVGIGGPPLCEPGEAEGTVLDVLLAASCEGYYMRAETVSSALADLGGKAWGIYSISDPGPPDEWGLVHGRWQVILVDTAAAPDSFQRLLSPWFDESGLSALFYACGQTNPGDLETPGTAPEFLLPPLT